MKAKRVLTLLLALMLVFALTACGGKKSQHQDEQTAEEMREEPAELKQIRSELQAEGNATVHIAGDLTFYAPLEIAGTKTLSGGSISVDSAADCLVHIPAGACLVLDGAVLDGGGNAKAGVQVDHDGSFEMRSGGIENTTRQAVRTEGKVNISGGGISTSGANWLYCAKGSDVTVSNGEFLLSDDVGITVFSGAKLCVSGGSFENAGNATIFNRGKTDITGGTITASGNYALSNESDMRVSGLTITGSLDRGDIYNFAGATIYVENSLLQDSASYCVYNNGKAELVGVTMKNSTSSSINNQNDTAELTMKNCTIDGAGTNGLYNKDAVAKLLNVTISNTENHAVWNRAGDVSAEKLTLRTAGGAVVYNGDRADGENTFGSITLKNFSISGAKGYGISNAGGTLKVSNGTVEQSGKTCLYVKTGTATVDGVTLKGTKEAGQAVMSVGANGYTNAKATVSNVTISGGARGISNHGTLTLLSGTISGNANSGDQNYGGGIYNFHVFTMKGGTISGNTSAKGGAGFYNSGTAYLYGGKITGNTANTHGGGVYNADKGKLVLAGVVIDGNTAGVYIPKTSEGTSDTQKGEAPEMVTAFGQDGVTVRATLVHADNAAQEESKHYGGGVYNLGSLTLENGTVISNNTASTNGGGLYNGSSDGVQAKCTLKGGTISGNTAGGNGGGLYWAGVGEVIGTKVLNNRADENGAGIYVTTNGVLKCEKASFESNASQLSGGAVYNKGTITIGAETVISGNTAGENGGGLYNGASGKDAVLCLIDKAALSNNTSGKGGGAIYWTGAGEVTNSTITDNKANSNGAGIYVTSTGKLTCKESTFTGNSAEKGGGIYLYRNTAEALLENLTMADNSSVGNGTAVYNNSGILHIVNGTFSSKEEKDAGYTVHSYQAEDAAVPVYKLEGNVKIDSIYVTANGNIELVDKLTEDASLGIRLNTTKDISKRTIIIGDGAVIKDSVGALSVINTSTKYTYQIKEDGKGSSTKTGGGGGGGGSGSTSSFTQYGEDTNAVISIVRGEQTVASELTLRNAVAQAQSGDTLVLCGDLTVMGNVNINKTLTLTDDGTARKIIVDSTKVEDTCFAPFYVTGKLTVVRSESGSLTVCGAETEKDEENLSFTVFYAHKNASVTLKNIAAQDLRNYGLDGSDNKNGSLAYCYKDGTVTLDGVTVKDCTNLKANAGVVHNYQGTLTVKDSTFTGNSAEKGGGVVYNSEGTLTVTNCKFEKNKAGTYGGALYTSGGSLCVSDCTFGTDKNKNTSGNVGSDIYANGTMTLLGETKALAIGLGSSGAIVCGEGFAVKDGDKCEVTFTANAFTACVDGTKIIVSGGSETVNKDSFTITNDEYYFDAEGYVKSDASPWLTLGEKSYVSLQSAVNAAAMGDTIYIDGDGTIRSAATINKAVTLASRGGARTITVAASKALTITDNVVISGSAEAPLTIAGKNDENLNGDAAIYVNTGKSLTMNQVTVDGIVNEDESKNGAAIYALGTVELNDVTIQNCQSGRMGAAIYVTSSGSATLNRCTVTGNSSNGNGGAINVYGSSTALGVLSVNNSVVKDNTSVSGLGADIYSSGAVSLSDSESAKTAIGEIYLAKGKTVTAASAAQNVDTKIGVGMGTFAPGETVITGDGAASYAAKITLTNNSGIAEGDQETILCADVGENLGKLIANPNLNVAKIDQTGYSTLAAAVGAAKDGDTIVITHDLSVGDTITIDKDITITDDGTARTIKLNAADTAYSLDIAAGKTVSITGTSEGGLTLTRGEDVTAKRAAVYVKGNLSVTGKVTVSGIANTLSTSTAANSGGVFCVAKDGTLTLTGTTFESCAATGSKGAAVYIASGAELTLDGVTMDGKTVSENGGDVYSNGNVTVEGKITGTTIYLAGSKTIVLGSSFDASSAISVTFTDAAIKSISGKTVLTGEGVADKYTCFTITNGVSGVYRFASNGTVPVGAATIPETGVTYDSLAAAVAAAEAEQTVVLTSDATISGTALSIGKGLTIMDDGTATRTITVNKTGGITVADGGRLTLKGSVDDAQSGLKITSTSSGLGSAMIAVANGGSLTLENALVDPNSTSVTRTALSVSGTAVVDHVVFNKCYSKKTDASVTGAAINVTSTGSVSATDCEFTNCYSAGNGGAIYVTGGSIALTDCTFSGNSVASGKSGADIYSNGDVSMAGEMTVSDICLAGSKTIKLTDSLTDGSSVSVSFTSGAWKDNPPSYAVLTDEAEGSNVAGSYGCFTISGHGDYCFNSDGMVAKTPVKMLLKAPLSGLMKMIDLDPAALPEQPVTGEEIIPTEQAGLSEETGAQDVLENTAETSEGPEVTA